MIAEQVRGDRSMFFNRTDRSRRRRSTPRPVASDAAKTHELRQQVMERAAARGARVPVRRAGHNPMTVTYTVGPEAYFYTSLDAFRRDTAAGRVDGDYAGWGHSGPRLVHEWSEDECREWLALNP